jgi:hypothetical protein
MFHLNQDLKRPGAFATASSGRGVKGAGRKAAVLLEISEMLYKITV